VRRLTAADSGPLSPLGAAADSRPLSPLGAAALALLLCAAPLAAHDLRVRRPLRLPDVPGFLTLQCDFHTHTVFSDGEVWPDVRAEEAWREGLDAIAITDHIEYLPHRADLPPSHERPWEIARSHGEPLGLLVIRGSEITRKMPPGHLNAVFLEAVTPLDTPEWRDALWIARAQGAFLFWNHPGWVGHRPDGTVAWYPEHEEICAAGLLDGIEVANAREVYPEAHRIALERDLAPLANSDVHEPIGHEYHVREGDHRPVTLVFARSRSLDGVREALFARRTVAYSGEVLVGREELLRPLVAASLTIENPSLSLAAGKGAYVRVRNDSDLRLELEGPGKAGELTVPRTLVLASRGTSLLEVKAPRTAAPGRHVVPVRYTVTNVRPTPDGGLPLELTVEVEVTKPPAP